MTFEWYEEIKLSDDITQGDIFINFPIIKISNYEKLLEMNPEQYEAEMEIEYVDLVVLTQPCDLARPKPELKSVILCQIYDVDLIKYGKGKLSQITEGKFPQFYMLNQKEDFKYEDSSFKLDGFNYHIVDFNKIEKVPVDALKKYSKNVSTRLRLLPPYREHLSQAFAKYFMRIGLPSDIDKSGFDKYSQN